MLQGRKKEVTKVVSFFETGGKNGVYSGTFSQSQLLACMWHKIYLHISRLNFFLFSILDRAYLRLTEQEFTGLPWDVSSC